MAYKKSDLPFDARQGLRRVHLAQISAPGSIAARDNPNNYGSIESRKYPGLFGPSGASNPEFVAHEKDLQHQQDLRQHQLDRQALAPTPEQRKTQIDQRVRDNLYAQQEKRRLLGGYGLRAPTYHDPLEGAQDPSIYDPEGAYYGY